MSIFLDIFQIRLDFDDVVLTQPSTTATSVGKCDGDNIAFTSASGTSLTSLCGTLTGTHSKAVSKNPSDYLDKMFFFQCTSKRPEKALVEPSPSQLAPTLLLPEDGKSRLIILNAKHLGSTLFFLK